MKKSACIVLITLVSAQNSFGRINGRGNGRQTGISALTTRADFNKKMESSKPTVIMLSSPSCSACPMFEEALTPVMKMYPQVEYYTVNISEPQFKALIKELDIKGIPTTYFITKGIKRDIRGSSNREEIENTVKELVQEKETPRLAARRIKKK